MADLSRRDYLLSSMAAVQIPGPRATPRQPNIIWALGEDTSPQLACYGEPLIQTPNMDRMAKEGARFNQAFTTAPVCSASRSALATGMFQTTIGAHNHRTLHKKPLPEGVRLMTHRLRDAGYFTVLANKNGASPKTDYNFVADKPFDGSDWSERPSGKPFFAQMTFNQSHKGPGWPLGRKTTPNIDQSKLKLPPYWPDHPVAIDEYANYLEAIQVVDRNIGLLVERLKTEGILDNTLLIYMGDNGSCTFRGKQFLYEGGIRVPLLVRWPDHVKPGTVRDDMICGVDLVGAALAAAGIEVPRNLHGRDFLGASTPRRDHIFAARDRCDTATERMRCVRDSQFKYIRNFLPGIPYMQENPYKEKEYPTWNLVKQLYKEGKLNAVQSLFPAPQKPVEELYDLKADPHEINNLAKMPELAERLKRMRGMVDTWIEETGDKGYIMEDPVGIYEAYYPKDRQ
ncbi:MAG: sulfatase [Bryobacteraceae bacterium]|nr:sulfatase [Bryobacteraceae bacterium]